jgi:hypothetical protein
VKTDRRTDQKGKEGRRRNRNKGGTSGTPWRVKRIEKGLTVLVLIERATGEDSR